MPILLVPDSSAFRSIKILTSYKETLRHGNTAHRSPRHEWWSLM